VPREFSEGYGGKRRRSEVDESKEQPEVEEESAEHRRIKEVPEQERNELEEAPDEVRESIEDAMNDLQRMEKDLGHRIEDAREDLHDEFVNDMREKLEEKSVKETPEESKESTEGSEPEETNASSESYIEGNDGMVYSMETGEVSESKAEVEVEDSPEEVKEGASETREVEESPSEDPEQEVSTKVRETVIRLENEEVEESKTDSKESTKVKEEQTTIDEYSIQEEETNEPKKVQPVKESVEDSQEVEDSVQREIKEENREVSEEEVDSEVSPEVSTRPEIDTSEVEEQADEVEIKEEESLEVEEREDDFELSFELPAEIEKQIDELVEELVEEIEPQEDEVEEKRIIVDAMTGKEHIDTSLEYRPYFEETEEETVEQEQKNDREKLADMFAELSEEAREKIKEEARSKLENEEDLDEMIERDPSVRASPDFKDKYADAKKYLRGKRKGAFPKLIKELLKDEVERLWTKIVLRKMNLKLREKIEDKEQEIKYAISIDELVPATWDEFEKDLRKHSKLLKRTNLEKEIELVKIYYHTKDEVESTVFYNMSKRSVWKYLAKKYKTSPSNLKRWFSQGEYPRLIHAVVDARTKAAGTSPKKKRISSKLRIPDTLDEFMSLLLRHPYLRDIDGFEEQLRAVEEYYRIRELALRFPGASYSYLAKQVNIKMHTARAWAAGRSKPNLLKRLLKNERLRRRMETKFSSSLHALVDPSIVFNTMQSMKTKNRQTLKNIVDVLEKLTTSYQGKITIVRLKPYNERHGPRWLLDIANKIERNRKKIERILNERFENTEIRVGLIDNNLYLWKYNPSQWNYLEMFSQERFYFKKKVQKQLVRSAREMLGLRGDYNLSELIRQMLKHTQNGKTRGRLVADFRPTIKHLKGNVLHFLLDVQDRKAKDIESDIERIGIGQQIANPRVLNETELKVLFARLFAIISSDGSIEPEHRVSYYEKNKTRQRRVRKIFQTFGQVSFHPLGDGFTNGFRVPNVVGRLLEKIGMPIGDKIIQGVRIPDFVMYGTREIQLAYLKELIPEEGWINISTKGNLGIAWGRSVILYDGEKANRYGFTQKLSKNLIELIVKKGTRKERVYDSGSREIFFTINMTKIQELMDDSDPLISQRAGELDRVIRENSSMHIEDERHLAASNGIMTSEQTPGEVRYSLASDRVSAAWQVRTANERDAILWGIIASPNDKKKQKRVRDWMKKNPSKVKEVEDKMAKFQRQVDRLLSGEKKKNE